MKEMHMSMSNHKNTDNIKVQDKMSSLKPNISKEIFSIKNQLAQTQDRI